MRIDIKIQAAGLLFISIEEAYFSEGKGGHENGIIKGRC
jgi:hypothetical protein